MSTDIETRVAKIEAFEEVHYEEFKEMYQNNREDHGKFFNEQKNMAIEISEIKTMTKNHLKHHERLFAIMLVFLGMLVPFMILLVAI